MATFRRCRRFDYDAAALPLFFRFFDFMPLFSRHASPYHAMPLRCRRADADCIRRLPLPRYSAAAATYSPPPYAYFHTLR